MYSIVESSLSSLLHLDQCVPLCYTDKCLHLYVPKWQGAEALWNDTPQETCGSPAIE